MTPETNKLNYEVMARDGFSCRCCGRTAPEVVLTIDIAKEGDRASKEPSEYITICRDCYEGKMLASKDSYLIKNNLSDKDINARIKEQLDEKVEWFKVSQGISEYMIDRVFAYAQSLASLELWAEHRSYIRDAIKGYQVNDVLIALDIVFSQYDKGSYESIKTAFDKLPGVLYNRKRAAADRRPFYFFYIRKESLSQYGECEEDILRELIWGYMRPFDEKLFNQIAKIIKAEKTWKTFKEKIWLTLDPAGKKALKEEKGETEIIKNKIGDLKGKDGNTYSLYKDAKGKGAIARNKGTGELIADKAELKKLFGI